MTRSRSPRNHEDSSIDRRTLLQIWAASGAGAVLISKGGIASASQNASPAAATAPSGTTEGGWPIYYPDDYDQIVEASKAEEKLIIYSIMSEKNWAPVLEAFTKRYDWLTVETSDLGSYEVFERYYPEASSQARTGDMIITSAVDAWQEFIDKGELVVYQSPEEPYVPEWTKLADGVYTVSTDPLVFMWNKQLVSDPPTTMSDLAAMIEDSPDDWKGKITSYDAEQVATGFAAFWFWIKNAGETGWDTLTTIGQSSVTLQSSAGRMVDATLSGESKLGFFVSTISIFPRYPAAEAVLGWGLIGDGTAVITRGMGITKGASSPNAAKLMMDFIMSQEGQVAFAEGGLTPYREDIADKVDFHLNQIIDEIGQENVLSFNFDPDLTDQTKTDEFLAKWKEAFGKQ